MKKETFSVESVSILMEASQEGFEPPTDGLAYHHDFRHQHRVVCSLDYIFTVSGATRVVSTEPHDNHLQKEYFAFDYSLVFLPSMK